MENTPKNIAYVDGQNLHLGTTKRDPEWGIDLARFRVYLEKKYRYGYCFFDYGAYVQARKV